MIKIETFVYNPFSENTYLLYDGSGECIIIDAGCEAQVEKDEITAYIEEKGLKPVKLVNTHCHVDHILGVSFLAKKYDLPFYFHEAEKVLFAHSKTQAEYFGLKLELPPEPAGYIKDGDRISFGDSCLEAIHIPGHSPGGILLHDPDQKNLISGDVLFQQSIGRTDLPGGDYDSLVGGIKSRILVLDPQTVVYPGHGPTTTIGEEKAGNPFLR
jgi:glyoxylase-like metal-dependent hydrolase (beta-lactamase superfamily II)